MIKNWKLIGQLTNRLDQKGFPGDMQNQTRKTSRWPIRNKCRSSIAAESFRLKSR